MKRFGEWLLESSGLQQGDKIKLNAVGKSKCEKELDPEIAKKLPSGVVSRMVGNKVEIEVKGPQGGFVHVQIPLNWLEFDLQG